MLPLFKTLISKFEKILLYSAIVVVLYLWYKDHANLLSREERFISNYEAVLQNNSLQQELTAKQFKKYYHNLDSIARSIKIKTKDITNVIETGYTYKTKDSTILSIHYKDSTIINEEPLPFIHFKECYVIEGVSTKDGIDILSLQLNDVLSTILYKKYDKKFLFWRYNSHVDATTYSECIGDTLQVQKNIKIIKDKRFSFKRD